MPRTMRAAAAGRSAGAQGTKKKRTTPPPPPKVPKVKSKIRPPTKNETPAQRRKRQGVKKPAGSRF